MKIYVVQVLYDVSNSFTGLDDTKIKLFLDKDKAIEYFKNKIEKLKNDFEDPEDYNEYIDMENLTFSINDEADYYSGRILEKELE